MRFFDGPLDSYIQVLDFVLELFVGCPQFIDLYIFFVGHFGLHHFQATVRRTGHVVQPIESLHF